MRDDDCTYPYRCALQYHVDHLPAGFAFGREEGTSQVLNRKAQATVTFDACFLSHFCCSSSTSSSEERLMSFRSGTSRKHHFDFPHTLDRRIFLSESPQELESLVFPENWPRKKYTFRRLFIFFDFFPSPVCERLLTSTQSSDAIFFFENNPVENKKFWK